MPHAILMAAAMVTAPSAHAQIQTAGELFVDIDATALPAGTLVSIANNGTLGGFFEARGGGGTVPSLGSVGEGTRGIVFDGDDFMQLVGTLGGSATPAPAGLVGLDPSRTIEVWALNPSVNIEETLVSWGHRGGPDGSNMSFNYGNFPAFGAVGHWGAPDIGWNDAGGSPEAGRWHHLVYTYDGTTTRVYSDGVLANSEVLGTGVINTHPGTAITLAAQTDLDGVTVTSGLRGSLSLARVRIHDGVLSDAQILSNYNAEKPGFIDPSTTTISGLTAAPTHRYSFNESPTADATGEPLFDSRGGENGVVLGAGAQLTGTRLVLPGGSSATQAYADLPNGLLSVNSTNNGGSGEVTIEGWVKVTGNQVWSRFFDFGSSGGQGAAGEVFGPGGGGEGLDYLIYTAQFGADTGVHYLEFRNEDPPGGSRVAVSVPSATFNTDLHFVVTWKESSGEIKAYENGIEVASMVAADAMSDINDVNVWLGRSNWTADQNTQAEYDEFRIYDHVLTPAEVRGTHTAGPDQVVLAVSFDITQQPKNILIVEGCEDTPLSPRFVSNFDLGQPFGSTVYGSAIVANGFLHLTDAVDVQDNSFILDDFSAGAKVESFKATFTASLRDSTCCSDGPNPRPADGFSFNFGTLPNGAFGFGEEGTDDGLVVSFDLWDNGAFDSDPAISIKYNGVEIAAVSMGEPNPSGEPAGTLPVPTDPATGLPMTLTTGPVFVPVEIVLESDGIMDVSYKGVKVLENIATGYVPRTGRFGFGAGTGAANSTHWIDDLSIVVNSPPELMVVTRPGDALLQVDGINDDDLDSGPPPPGELPLHAIDGVTQKYLNFLDLGSGFIVTPSMGPTVVSAIRLYTANDAEERDPASYILEGSRAGDAGPWTLISQGELALPAGRNRGGSIPIDPATQFHQELSFANSAPYTSYRVTFPTLKDATNANSMQIGEVELLGRAGLLVVTQPGDSVVEVMGVNDGDGNDGPPPSGELPLHAIDGVTQKYLNFLDLGSGFVVTPSMGPTVVSAIRLYTANDAEERDPASYVLEGSRAGDAGPWTLISQGDLALPAGRNRGGSIPIDPATQFHQALSFANSAPYTSYRVTFPTLKDAAAANSMQIGEVELLGRSAQSAGVILDEDFASGDGGFTVLNGIEGASATVGAEGWTYDIATGSWRANGGEGVKNSTLGTPPLTVRQSGQVRLTFNHRYNFEDDGTSPWDGGAVFISINGGAFSYVPGTAFEANGYEMPRPIAGNSPPLNGLFGFNNTSAGFASGQFITSVANLGTFATGDTISVRFVGAWDEFNVQSPPNWEVDSVQLALGLGNFVRFSVKATATEGSQTNRFAFIQWQRDDGAGFANIAGANGAAYSFMAYSADNGARFRAAISAGGATTYSDEVTYRITSAPVVSITSPADGSSYATFDPITITAAANDSDGSVVQVQFFADDVGLIGVDNDGSDGWSVTIAGSPAGSYTLTAVATDNLGASCSSDQVTVIVELAILFSSTTQLPDGSFQSTFNSDAGISFIVLASTEVAKPLSEWNVIGVPIEGPAGNYQFTDQQANNFPQRFYAVVPGTLPPLRWASRVLAFSSEFSSEAWSADQLLGSPDTYPDYGDIATAWASSTSDDQPEFLEVGFDVPAPIHSVSIYETFAPGAVNRVAVRNPNTGQWVEVWSGSAAAAPEVSRIFTVTFPETSFPVDAVRIELDSPAVPGWNEIDAVGINW